LDEHLYDRIRASSGRSGMRSGNYPVAMAQRGGDPYFTLGVRPGASDQEVRGAYRRLVQLHHPDHNGGSAESARRFEEVQEAYAEIRQLRARSPRAGATPPPPAAPDPDLEARLAGMERDLREAHVARERARRAAAEVAARERRRPTDEELGYIKTDDSLSKIFADARGQLSEQLADLFDDAREEINRRRK
jgi:curved DNA-binding protein CbpA